MSYCFYLFDAANINPPKAINLIFIYIFIHILIVDKVKRFASIDFITIFASFLFLLHNLILQMSHLYRWLFCLKKYLQKNLTFYFKYVYLCPTFFSQ